MAKNTPKPIDASNGIDFDKLGADSNDVAGGLFMDLTDVSTAVELIPAGIQAVVSVTKAEAALSSSGYPMIKTVLKLERIVKAPGVDNAERFLNRSIRELINFVPPRDGKQGTLGMARRAIEAVGVEWPAMQFRTREEMMTAINALGDQMLGGIASIVVGIDENKTGAKDQNNEPYPPRNRVAYWLKPEPETTDTAGSNEELPF